MKYTSFNSLFKDFKIFFFWGMLKVIDMKTRETQRPLFIFTMNSIKWNLFLKKRRGYCFLIVLRSSSTRGELEYAQICSHHMFIGWWILFSSPASLLLLRHSLHFQGWKGKKEKTYKLNMGQWSVDHFLNKNNLLSKWEWKFAMLSFNTLTNERTWGD